MDTRMDCATTGDCECDCTSVQAKGLEWPRVELADDFVGLAEKFTSASEKVCFP